MIIPEILLCSPPLFSVRPEFVLGFVFLGDEPVCWDGMLAPEITPEELVELRRQPQPPVVVDVREMWEYDTAHLPDTLLMPMGDVSSRAHAELDPDAPVIVMCHHGARSLNVTMWLRAQGFEGAQSLAGGIDGWSRNVDPAVPRY